MKVELQDIQGLSEEFQTIHKIKTLSVEGRDPARVALLNWKRNAFADWKKLMKAIRYVGTHARKELVNPSYVKKCDCQDYGDVFEFRAHKGKPRLFFFFSPVDASVVICTNSYEKDDSRRGKTGGQDAAFAHCAQMKLLFERSLKP